MDIDRNSIVWTQIVQMFAHCYKLSVFYYGICQWSVATGGFSMLFKTLFCASVKFLYILHGLSYLLRSLFVLLYFFFWLLCCLSFDLQILITSLWYLHALLTCDSMWTFWVEANFCLFFIVCLYNYPAIICCTNMLYE